MKIVIRNSDNVIVMVANCSTDHLTPIEDYTIHDLPGWDWSLADTTGVDKSNPHWWSDSMQWNGTTLVPKP